MRFGFDNILGGHDTALVLRAQRAQVLAANIANADTPNYKARDFHFQDALIKARADLSGVSPAVELGYRVPAQTSLDGNTVDGELEMTEFLQNAMQFQTSFTILNSRFIGLINAFKGD